jgi:hypothetical protein
VWKNILTDYQHVLSQHDIIPLIQNIRFIKEVLLMQDIMRVNQKEKRRDIWQNYDPEKAIEGIRKSKGALKGVDRETLQREIRDQRGYDSHSRPAS